jgi:dolichol-phosphate mannosyltransferase
MVVASLKRTSLQPKISVVLPAYNEATSIVSTLDRILQMARSHLSSAADLEVVVVSDGSSDATFDKAAEHLAGGNGGSVIQLVRNVGSHSAIRCGLDHAKGEIVIIMAADGQDPPEIIPELLAALQPGIDVVWGQRRSRDHDPILTRLLAGTYYRLFRTLTGFDYPPSGFDFVAMRRLVVEALLSYQERNTSVFLLIFNLGFSQTSIEYERGQRQDGSSGWTFRKRAKLAVDMLTAFSAAPIRLLSLTGVIVGAFGLIFGGITMVRGLLGQIPISGWASLMVISSLMSGLMLMALGFLGEYVWRTLDEVRGRPLYLEGRRADLRPAHAPGSENEPR